MADNPGKYSNGKRKPIGTMNLILIIVLVLLIVFTVVMVILFLQFGMIPDTLCTCVFGTLGGECGILGWIKVTKEKRQERKWQLQDRAAARAEAANNVSTTAQIFNFDTEDTKYV